MILYLQVVTPVSDLIIDYIEVKLKSGEIVSLNWDESVVDRGENGFTARYKGLYFGEKYANGRINELRDMQVTGVGLYSETAHIADLKITSMWILDDNAELSFEMPIFAVKGCDTNG